MIMIIMVTGQGGEGVKMRVMERGAWCEYLNMSKHPNENLQYMTDKYK